MMKLGRFSLSRLHSSEKLLPGKAAGVGDASGITTVAKELFGSVWLLAYLPLTPCTKEKLPSLVSLFYRLLSGDFQLERKRYKPSGIHGALKPGQRIYCPHTMNPLEPQEGLLEMQILPYTEEGLPEEEAFWCFTNRGWLFLKYGTTWFCKVSP